MRKYIILGTILVLGITGLATAQKEPKRKNPTVRPATSQPAKTVPDLRRILRTTVPQVEWEDAPFGDVIAWLREQGELNVVVRWNVLQEVGIDEDTPVSLRLKDAKIATILAEVLAQLGQSKELRFIGIGRTLTISTHEDLNKKLYVKAYPVNDLLFRIPDFADAPSINLQQGGGGGGPGGGSASQNPFQGGTSGGGPDEDNRSRSERIKEMIEMIKETVEPTSWKDNGGEGTISSFNNTVLVVRATLDVHERLGGPLLLEE
jgi:hypothetical protein